MVWNPMGWGYGGIGYSSPVVRPIQQQAPSPRSAQKQPSYGRDAGVDARAFGAQPGQRGALSSSLSNAASNLGNQTAGRNVGLGLSIAANMLGLGISPMRAMSIGKALNAQANQDAYNRAFANVAQASSGYGIGAGEVAAGVAEGQSSHEGAAPGGGLSGDFEGLGALGTGGQGGIDTAGDNEQDDGGCFITSATSNQFGWGDDCKVLEIFRKFRDDIVLKMPNGAEDVREYYEVAPRIASALTKKQAREIWDKFLKKSINAIVCGKYLRAYKIYKNMVLKLTN